MQELKNNFDCLKKALPKNKNKQNSNIVSDLKNYHVKSITSIESLIEVFNYNNFEDDLQECNVASEKLNIPVQKLSANDNSSYSMLNSIRNLFRMP